MGPGQRLRELPEAGPSPVAQTLRSGAVASAELSLLIMAFFVSPSGELLLVDGFKASPRCRMWKQ